MPSKVAVVEFDEDYSKTLKQALDLIGGIEDLNTAERNVVVKVGVFHPRSLQHASVGIVNSIINNFNKAPKIFLAESDNYCGKSLERLQIYKDLFTERVVPYSLSDDTAAKKLRIVNEEMNLSHILFKPNKFVDTHILRNFQRGSILKNLFGCTPTVKKAKYHKKAIFYKLLADIYEAIGGIDLAVIDGTRLFHSGTEVHVRTNTLIIGRDAVAVETVGATLAGLKPERMQLIQEFVNRGLGEGNIENIEIIGTPFEKLQEKFKSATKELKARYNARPRPLGISATIDKMTEEGWMNQYKRISEIVDELIRRGVSNATYSVVSNTLRRRRGKTLEGMKDNSEWIYRRKRN